MTSAFHSWSDFWQMGGYAFYVWLAVAVTVIALLILFIHTRWQRRALLAMYAGRWRASGGYRRRVSKAQ